MPSLSLRKIFKKKLLVKVRRDVREFSDTRKIDLKLTLPPDIPLSLFHFVFEQMTKLVLVMTKLST